MCAVMCSQSPVRMLLSNRFLLSHTTSSPLASFHIHTFILTFGPKSVQILTTFWVNMAEPLDLGIPGAKAVKGAFPLAPKGNKLLDGNDWGLKNHLCNKNPQGWSLLSEGKELYRFQPGSDEHPDHKYISDFRNLKESNESDAIKWEEKHTEIKNAAKLKHAQDTESKVEPQIAQSSSTGSRRKQKIHSTNSNNSDTLDHEVEPYMVTADETRRMHFNFDKKYTEGWTMHRNGQVIGHYQPGPEMLPGHKHIQDYRYLTNETLPAPRPYDPVKEAKEQFAAIEKFKAASKSKGALRQKAKKDYNVSSQWVVPDFGLKYDIDKVVQELEEVDIKEKSKCKSRRKGKK